MNINVFNKYRLRFGIYFSISKLEFRDGVCSRSYNEEKHMILWDFDETSINKIIQVLQALIKKYRLPKIYIFESSENHYHAYCFASRTLQEVIHILSATDGIDTMYLRLGMARGYYTLRFSKKGKNPVKIIKIINSKYPEEMKKTQVTVTKYLTTNT